ncbi:MAG TPA: prolipoprotein diacylglyceryl transferase [Xanthomonadaceae bacterium]|nr:prolipoprotein diacylglyceryl transferase [Xanthomonadaceae bacterium]
MTYLHDLDPVALQLGPVSVHWYGIMYMLAFASAWYLGMRRIGQRRLPVDGKAFGDLAFYAFIGVLLGGRLGYILFYGFAAALEDPLSVLRIWQGGMSFHGGLLGVMLAGVVWSMRHRLHVFDTMDFVAPLVPVGVGLGRLGNFINGELWGKPTGGGWGVVFPDALPSEYAGLGEAALRQAHASGALDAFARHPTQLYELFLEGVVMFALLWWYSARPRPRYAVSGMFALLYGVFRFAVELLRVPDAHIGYLAFGWLTMGQLLSLPLVALGLGLLWMSRRAPMVRPATPAQG